MSDATTVQDVDNVRWVRFDRPTKRNALRVEDVEVVRAAVRQAPDDCRCIVFSGCNGHFSAGADVTDFSGASMGTLEVGVSSPGQMLLQEVRTCPRPTVAAIEGYCVGIAMDLTAVCDIRVASRSARFSMPEVKIGIPVIGDASLFERYIGLARSKEMLLTGGWYSAEQMNDWGYLNQLTEVGGAEEAAGVYAKQLSGLPPRTIAAQKRIFEAWLQLPHREAHRVSVLEYAVTVAHPETAEWIAQFQASRRGGKKS